MEKLIYLSPIAGRILLETPNKEVPIDYKLGFVSFFKKALEGTPFEKLYERKLTKPFSFSVYFPMEKIEGDKVILKSGQFKLIFSSLDSRIFSYIYLAFGKYTDKYYIWRDFKFKFLKSEGEKTKPRIENNGMLVKTISPVYLEEKVNGKVNAILPPSMDEDNFWDKLKEFNEKFNRIQEKLITIYGIDYKPVFIFPLDVKTKIIKLNYRRKNSAKFITFAGKLFIKGDPQILEILYYKGLGLKTGEGFGAINNICV
jgi:CRISPR-associated endoribonuclease Cas6